ncbi:MAG: hypothetical protein Q8O89_09110 [Nanoarchaeota archaeon]|nr:hypothetical protein [Nanoarchaeota archaeon]
MDKDKDINITYETLFEILRREKQKDELQKLDDSFFSDVITYLSEKENIVDNQQESSNMFAIGEKEKTLQQLDNIRKILKELYDRREKKLINMAINKARTNSNIINTTAMLAEEQVFFDCLVDVFTKFRKEVLFSLLEGKVPEISKDFFSVKKKEKKETKLIRFVHAVPKFLGKELETYGPFTEDDIANLPSDIADVLIKKERAEEIEEE